MNDFWTRIVLEVVFISGSIISLYCLYILWAKKSYRNSKKPYEWNSFDDRSFLF